MSKLTIQQREDICTAILDHRFKPDAEGLDKAAKALGVKVYERVFTRKQREVIEGLPKGWMAEDDWIQITVGTRYIRLPLDKKRRLPFEQRRGCILAVEATDALGEQIVEHDGKKHDLKTNREAARRQILATLGSFNTVKTLRSGWPEIAAFVDEVVKIDPTPKLPAPVIRELNASMKSPPNPSQTPGYQEPKAIRPPLHHLHTITPSGSKTNDHQS